MALTRPQKTVAVAWSFAGVTFGVFLLSRYAIREGLYRGIMKFYKQEPKVLGPILVYAYSGEISPLPSASQVSSAVRILAREEVLLWSTDIPSAESVLDGILSELLMQIDFLPGSDAQKQALASSIRGLLL
jgi:hypothetical protein